MRHNTQLAVVLFFQRVATTAGSPRLGVQVPVCIRSNANERPHTKQLVHSVLFQGCWVTAGGTAVQQYIWIKTPLTGGCKPTESSRIPSTGGFVARLINSNFGEPPHTKGGPASTFICTGSFFPFSFPFLSFSSPTERSSKYFLVKTKTKRGVSAPGEVGHDPTCPQCNPQKQHEARGHEATRKLPSAAGSNAHSSATGNRQRSSGHTTD